MQALKKALLSYFDWFGGAVVFLTVCGFWNDVEKVLIEHRVLGIGASLAFLFWEWVRYDSVDKVARSEFENRRRGRRGTGRK